MKILSNFSMTLNGIVVIHRRLGLNSLFVFCSLLLFSNSFAQSISTGNFHSFTICNDHTIQAWGYNGHGEFGNGVTKDTNKTATATGITNIEHFAGGGYHTVYLKDDSTAWTCGRNIYGALGDGTTTDRLTPVQATGLSSIIAVAAAGYFSLFLHKDNTVWACGDNYYGQLGDGTNTDRLTAVHIGLTGIIAMQAGYYHSLFLKNDGTAWSTGRNTYGELGDGTTTGKNSPVQVSQASGLTYITKIQGGARHCLFVKSDSTAWATGLNNYGQLGDGTTTSRSTPVQVSGLTGIKDLAATYYGSMFLKSDSTVWVTGLNNYGQLGDGTTTNRSTPVKISSLNGIVAMSGGQYHAVFLKKDGTVWATGNNDFGQLGDGTNISRSTPVQVSGLCPVLLPIELLSFNAVAMGNKVKLTWSTASETNNNFFTIEKSLDGTNWKSIGIVIGAGNSTHVLNYESFDTEPEKGIQYYKLKQTDYDGQYKYSAAIAINFSDGFNFSIYPNPVYANSGTAVQLNFNQLGEDSKPILVVVYDAMGQETLSKVNIIDKNNGQVTAVDPSNKLSPGVYIISATSDNSIYKQKLIVK